MKPDLTNMGPIVKFPIAVLLMLCLWALIFYFQIKIERAFIMFTRHLLSAHVLSPRSCKIGKHLNTKLCRDN